MVMMFRKTIYKGIMKKYLIIALAALGFAACAEKMNDGPSPEQTGELEQSYIAINLMSSELDTRVNDDPPVLEDGEAAERKVNSVHFFFFRQGVPFAVNAAGTAPGGGKNWLQATTPEFREDLDEDNISAYSNVMLVLNNYKGQYPDQIVAVINWNPEGGDYTLAKLQEALSNLRGNADGFVMSNSVYRSDNGEVVNATSIPRTYKTAAEAEDAPVDIYVERIAAKVKVNTPAASDADWNAEKQWFNTGKSSDLITIGEKKVYVKIRNWSLYNARSQSNVLKSINPQWTDGVLGLAWNNSPYHRSYWADANEYNSTFVNNNDLNWSNGNPLRGATYCGENTADKTEDRTKLVLKGQLVNADGAPFELVKWNGQEMVEVDNLKIAVASQLQYQVFSYIDLEDPTTHVSITPDDIECISGAEVNAPDGVENYEVYFALSTLGQSKDWAIKNGDILTPYDDSHINDHLALNIPPAIVYASGMTYYFIDIKHLGTAGKKAEFGVVRNHIYDIVIESIKGYGTPVYVPTGNLVPETPTEEEAAFVAAKINVLSWRVVHQGVDIVQ